jgi:hypothetical protein
VTVPEEALVRPDSPGDSPGDCPPDCPPDNPVYAQIARLEGEFAGLREALAEARARATEAETRADATEARADAEAAKTAQAIWAFESLAERLEAMAPRPKRRRLFAVGGSGSFAGDELSALHVARPARRAG